MKQALMDIQLCRPALYGQLVIKIAIQADRRDCMRLQPSLIEQF